MYGEEGTGFPATECPCTYSAGPNPSSGHRKSLSVSFVPSPSPPTDSGTGRGVGMARGSKADILHACRVGAGSCAYPFPFRDHSGFPSNTAGQCRIHTKTASRRWFDVFFRLRPSSGGPPTGSPRARRLPLTLRQAQEPGGVIGRKFPPPLRGRAREGGPPTTSPPPHSSPNRFSLSRVAKAGSQPRHLLAAFRIDIVTVAVLQFEISALFVAAGRALSLRIKSGAGSHPLPVVPEPVEGCRKVEGGRGDRRRKL